MSQGFFTSGYLVEDRERAPVDTLKVLPESGAYLQPAPNSLRLLAAA